MGCILKDQKIPAGSLIEFGKEFYYLESYGIDFQKLAIIIEHEHPAVIRILHGTKLITLNHNMLSCNIIGYTDLFTVIKSPLPQNQWEYFYEWEDFYKRNIK